MKPTRTPVLAAAALALLAACSFDSGSLWPTDAEPAAAAAAEPAAIGAPPPVGTSRFEPPGVTPGASTGTVVGDKIQELRGDLGRLQTSVGDNNRRLQELRARVVEDSQRFHGTVAAINTRLQVGTTPGNPILVQQFNSAEADLDRLAAGIGAMNELATDVTADSTMAAYLAESTRATFRISGAVDEDHRQLAILQDEVDRTSVLVDRLLTELSEDIRRQSEYIATERGNLNLLASGIRSGEIYGASLLNQAMFAASGVGPPGLARTDDFGARQPLIVIRFDRDTVPYQQALYNTVSQVLERQPNALFDLVAVAPALGDAGRVALNTGKVRRQAEGVMRSLVDMGLPPARIAMTAGTSQTATTNEVRLYVR